jgi:DNA-binding GntR family transcriptional regulator
MGDPKNLRIPELNAKKYAKDIFLFLLTVYHHGGIHFRGNFRAKKTREIHQLMINVNRETIVDKLVKILQESILSGKIKAKTRLSEASVAKQFGVSRVPAREAMQRLEEMNFLRKNHLGREVVEFSRNEFCHIYELKNIIEAYGAMQGALQASEEELAEIQAKVQQMEICVSSGALEKLRRLNYEFHDLLVACGPNRKLKETYLSLVKQIRWATPLSLNLPARPVASFQEHEEIFGAFRRKESEKVRTLLEAHSDGSMKRVLAQMEAE